ncbi:MAG: sigma-70 family RNA polymerase sigma factor [Actinomycetota bacterium]|nr:sigma-70 family RNA polymerase sigma factor [Actinomycetota bacterium]
MSSDSEIIHRSRDSPGAFAELYDRHAPAIHRYAAGRVGAGAADDVMSETFLVAFERRAAFDLAVTDARPWLFGIATTLMRKHARLEAKAWRGMNAELAAHVVVDGIAEMDAQMDARASVERLGPAIRRMNSGDRDVLLLYAWADLSYEEIAAALAIPIGTVRSRLNRARRLLRKALNRGQAPEKEVESGRAAPAAPSA